MTTVPQPPSIPSTTAQAASSAAAAAGSAGGNGPHGDATANGKTAIPPAVPSINGPTIANGNNAVGQHQRDHSRKSSVTISAAGTSGQMPNGGPVAGGKPATGNGIQFGSMNASTSPGVTHSTPSAPAATSAAAPAPPVAAPTGNPRITSPANSPSPIPQPPASGGRPPSSIHGQGNGLSFGSLGGDDRRGSMPASMTPNMPNAHMRRESTPSAPGEMSNGMGFNGGRGGYPHQGGRGRGYPHQQYGGQMPYSPNNSFRAPNAPRGGGGIPPQFVPGRGMAPAYQQPPHQVSRSPSMTASTPIHPAGGQMPMQNHQIPQQHFYPQGMPQGQYMGQYDPNFGGYYGAAPYMPQPGMPMPQPFVPQSPRGYPGQPPQPYMQGQYNQQGPQPMSRGSSNRSDQQSGMGPQQTGGQASGHQPSGTRSTNSPGPKSNTTFQIPTKRSAGIVIKDPNSGAVKTFDKQINAPTPSKSPANSNAAPTPPPPVSKTPNPAESSHSRTDSQSVKTSSEKAQEMAAAVRKKLEDDKRREREEEEQKQAGEKVKAGEEAKSADASVDALAEGVNKLKVDDETPAKPAETVPEKTSEPEVPKVVEPAVEEKKDVPPEEDEDSDEYWARIEAEEAERERKEAEREAEYQKKKAAERAEKAKREAEEAARQDEEMKKAEREAEEAEEARIKKQAQGEVTEDDKDKDQLFASLKKSDNAFQVSKTSSETPPGLETPDESGTATPVSQTSSSMPPPARAGTKPKPPSLVLETTKQVEPPQPSAALQSLRSAKFLTAINDATYPAAIASPNPALNSAAPSGKFRYDKDFLLQFQKVFTEKPSETWTDKVKETVGDTSDTGSARRSNPTGPRPQQRPGGFNMAVFNMNQGGPGPGPSAGGRFPSGNKQQPLRVYNSNNPMSFPINLNQRTPSNTSIGAPGSPRQTGSRRSKPKRENDKDAKTMPLTAGMDIKPIQVSEKGWKPPSIAGPALGPPPGGDAYLAPDVVQRKVKSALNKMTPSTFDKISDQILAIVQQSQKETDGRTLLQVIGLTFEKATDEAHWAAMYANFCSKMLGFVQNLQPEIRDETLPLDKNGKVVSGGTLFRKYLLNRCQQDFEAGWQSKLPSKPEDGDGASKEAEMLSDEYYKAAAAKRKGLGLVRFIGELFKLGMLTSRIMHMCVKKLVDFDGMPDEAEVESLASLLKTVGGSLDSEEKARPSMDAYFDRINAMINLEGLPSRMRFMLMDIVDMRRTGWKVKDAAKGPATIEEIRAQAAQQEREREAQRAADNARRGGGGGRMGLGRGDARNYSHGPMPPPQSNTVGMDDLRRLGRSGSRQTSSQGPLSLGPTSMFAARGSNPRKPMGGGLLGRGGDDSGGSSRTGTPPAGKEKKEDSKTTNAFSALAGLGDSGEHADHPGSPPSTKGSPPVSHARTVMERSRTRSKSPLKGEEKA